MIISQLRHFEAKPWGLPSMSEDLTSREDLTSGQRSKVQTRQRPYSSKMVPMPCLCGNVREPSRSRNPLSLRPVLLQPAAFPEALAPEWFATWVTGRTRGLRPISLLRISLLRLLDSNLPENPLWAGEFHPLTKIKILLGSNPLKSRILVGRLAILSVPRGEARAGGVWHGKPLPQASRADFFRACHLGLNSTISQFKESGHVLGGTTCLTLLI